MRSTPLAIDGGPPVRAAGLPYGRHDVGDDDVAAVAAVLRSDAITQGRQVALFEQAVADYCDAEHAVAFSTGTAALHAACAAAGLGPGDEAITTPLTFAATANAVAYCGATPVFADIRHDTLNIDPRAVEKRLSARTKVILPVDFAGQPADLDAIREIADDRGAITIEDACHALGARSRGRKIGRLSTMTVFSFHPVKHVTTGEGGMVVTADAGLAARLRTFRHHGIEYPDPARPWRYEIRQLGQNYRLTDFQCALGLSQLRSLDERLERRRVLSRSYDAALRGLKEVRLPAVAAEDVHAWHIFVVLLELERLRVDRDAAIRALRAENIGVTVHYPLVHQHPFYRERYGYGEGLCPVAEAIAPRLLTLPLFPSMTEGDVADVVTALDKVLAAFKADGASG